MLPSVFLNTPITHRAYHAVDDGRPENSPAAIRAAIAQGYGIEIDLQLSADGQAMVFHDYTLERLTDAKGPTRLKTASELSAIPLKGGGEGIPTLTDVLALVAGQVPLLIEIKDQDGAMGKNIGPLEAATAAALSGYAGPVAVMSFNPHSVAEMARLAPDVPRGLTTSAFAAEHWPYLSEAVRKRLAPIPDFARTGACFISHDVRDLAAAPVAALKERGVPVLCWTVRSAAQEAEARKVADNITFEGYPARRDA